MATKGISRKVEGKLDEKAWIEAALGQLAAEGIAGVRVELLAKRLAVTKGSFYWHFKDRDALHERMLEHWRRHATLQLIERLDRNEASPAGRLKRLLRLPIQGRSASAAEVELAIRLWARRDDRARAALAEVDQLRLRYIESLLMLCGVPAEEADARAVLAYSYIRVAATLVMDESEDFITKCEALLMGNHLHCASG